MPTAKELFIKYKCCVVIPTFNNGGTLTRILNGVMEHADNIFVINDGSTDNTKEILNSYNSIQSINLQENRGKGNALKLGLKTAIEQGYDYAITLDSDGQHFPEDIPLFLNALSTSSDKNLMIIGDRNMNEAEVLSRSAKGNRVSSFWVHAATGLRLKDSQSGFRLYPLQAISQLSFYDWTRKFEFEVEVIVKSYWAGVTIQHVPIKILYNFSERVSHFRPFMDIARIVILITWFLIMRLCYIIPRDFVRKLKEKGLGKFLREDLLQSGDSPRKKALSIALGVFIGLSPFWGLHTVLVIFLAVLLRLNKVIAFTFSNISLPPFIPLVIFLSTYTGNFVLGQNSYFSFEEVRQNFNLVRELETYFVGSLVLSTIVSVAFGLIGYFILLYREKNTKLVNV